MPVTAVAAAPVPVAAYVPVPVSDGDKKKAEDAKVAANGFFSKQNFEQAIIKYSEAIDFNPNDPVYFANRYTIIPYTIPSSMIFVTI